MSNPTAGLKLCDEAFLKHFTADFLASLELKDWDKSMGPRDRLSRVKSGSMDIIFVDSGLSYDTEHLLCWGDALSAGGYLALEAIEDCNPQMLADNLEMIFEYQPVTDNRNIWLLRKKPLAAQELLQQNLSTQLLNYPVTDYRVQNALNQLEQSYPRERLAPYTRAQIYNMQGVTEAAVNSWLHYFFRNPQPNLHYFTLLQRLNIGDYPRGFRQREFFLGERHSIRSTIPPSAELLHKCWQGEPLAGKHLVVWSEFGLGDEIMFSQLAHYLKTLKPAQLTFIVQPPIAEIMRSHPDIDQIIDTESWREQSIEFDYWVYPHSILAHVSQPFAELPKRIPYLFADPARVATMAPRIKANTGLKIGLVWRGSSTHENDHCRSIHHLAPVESLLSHNEYQWFCLQKELNEAEWALMERYSVPLIGPGCRDFSDTAAALANLDLLISVDTSVAHLAGAMNVPTFLLLPFVMDSRWGLERENLWYPSIQAFRQSSPLIYWPEVIEQVIKALEGFAGNKKST